MSSSYLVLDSLDDFLVPVTNVRAHELRVEVGIALTINVIVVNTLRGDKRNVMGGVECGTDRCG